jgi:hypothetical protein
MAAYVCRICGEKANSKCVGQRSVFQDDQLEALLSHSLKFKVTRVELPGSEGCKAATKTMVELTYLASIQDAGFELISERDSLLEMFKMIRGLPQETIDHYSCMHQWKLMSAECDLGCCKHKE